LNNKWSIRQFDRTARWSAQSTGSVEQVTSPRLGHVMIESVDLETLTVADMNKGWNRCSGIEQFVHLDCHLALTKTVPTATRQTMLDGRYMESIAAGI